MKLKLNKQSQFSVVNQPINSSFRVGDTVILKELHHNYAGKINVPFVIKDIYRSYRQSMSKGWCVTQNQTNVPREQHIPGRCWPIEWLEHYPEEPSF